MGRERVPGKRNHLCKDLEARQTTRKQRCLRRDAGRPSTAVGSCCSASVAHVPLISLTHVAWDCWYRKSLETLSGFLSYQTGGQTRLLLPEVPSCSSVHSHTSEVTIRCTRQMACTSPIYFSCLNEPHRSSHNWFASSDVPTLLLTQVDVLAGPLAAWATMEMQRCWFFWMEKPLSWWSIITPLPRLVRA